MSKDIPAFPCKRIITERKLYTDDYMEREVNEEGMTLRDYFAGQALIAALPERLTIIKNCGDLSKWCYGVADAMLKERSNHE